MGEKKLKAIAGSADSVSSARLTKNKIIETPQGEALNISGRMWLALGVVGYNHAILSRRPLPIVEPTPGLLNEWSSARWKRGVLVVVNLDRMNVHLRGALIQISEAVLRPLGVIVDRIPESTLAMLDEQEPELAKAIAQESRQ